jgi:hypothetical protein
VATRRYRRKLTAILILPGTCPTPVVCDLLGVPCKTATRWAAHSGGDGIHDVAARGHIQLGQYCTDNEPDREVDAVRI